VTFLYTAKMGRFYEFPAITHFTDVLLAVSSIFIIRRFKNNLQHDLYHPGIQDDEYKLRIFANM